MDVADASTASPSGLTPEASPVDLIRQGLHAVLERAGLQAVTIAAVRATPLSFTMEGGGKQWLATYNLEVGSVSGRDVTVHGYPADEVNFRWIWAILVDATAVVLVCWGLSGRVLGSVCLLGSTVAATWIGIGVYAAIAAMNR